METIQARHHSARIDLAFDAVYFPDPFGDLIDFLHHVPVAIYVTRRHNTPRIQRAAFFSGAFPQASGRSLESYDAGRGATASPMRAPGRRGQRSDRFPSLSDR